MARTEAWTEKPAGFWIRWVAQFVDSIVVVIPPIILGALVGALLAFAFHLKVEFAIGVGYVIYLALFIFGSGAYFTLMTARSGQTLGKKLLNLKVIGPNGEGLSIPRSLGRWAANFLSYLPLMLGYVMAAFTPEKRALHDYVADTKVVRTGPLSNQAMVAAWIVGAFFLLVPVTGILAAIAIPKFAQMQNLAAAGATKAELGAIRSALALYNADQGTWPPRLEDLVEGKQKYLDAIPAERIKKSSRVRAEFDGQGGWVYDPKTGKVLLNVEGVDRKGVPYKDYGLE